MKTKKKVLILVFSLIVSMLFAEGASTVYVTASRKKYHQRNCRTLSKYKNVKSLSIDVARKQGYTPCKACYA